MASRVCVSLCALGASHRPRRPGGWVSKGGGSSPTSCIAHGSGGGGSRMARYSGARDLRRAEARILTPACGGPIRDAGPGILCRAAARGIPT